MYHFGPFDISKLESKRKIPRLIKLLRHNSLGESARSALQRLGIEAVEDLIAALKNRNASMRKKVVEVLGGIHCSLAIDALIAALHDSDDCVRRSADTALEKISTMSAIEPMISALKNGSEYVRKQAVTLLGNFGIDYVFDALTSVLKDSDDEVRKAAVLTLAHFKDNRVIKFLIPLFNDAATRKIAADEFVVACVKAIRITTPVPVTPVRYAVS